MPNRLRPTWITVMDGAQARFFVLRRGEDGQIFEEAMESLSAKLPARSGRNDKPGRGQPSAGERHTKGLRDRDSKHFARLVAGALDNALAGKHFDQLVVVAPSRNLAELRELLSARVRETLVHQIPKNFTKFGTDALWEKLSLVLLKAARPVNGQMNATGARVPTVSGNSLPVSVVFRNMEASPSVQSVAVKYAARLGRKFGRIQNCRVIVDAPKHEHRKVREFRVAVDLKLPGHQIASKSASSDGGAYDDLNLALRDAFATAARQLQEHMHRIKANVLRERRQSSPRVRGLVEA